jgi:hypothetical protein
MEKTDSDKFKSILIERNGSENLLIAFGGLKLGIGIPKFEFYNSISGIDCDKIFLRDFNQAWYHKGVTRKINSIESVKEFLQEKILLGKYQSVCLVGNSMGGFAAILFGTLLGVDNVICFSPQTFLNRGRRWFIGEKRWQKELELIYNDKRITQKIFDLKTVLSANDCIPFIQIFFSVHCKLDAIHAKRLEKYKNVILHPLNYTDHNTLVKSMRDSGQLHSIFHNFFEKNDSIQ